jgi:hypothetical protein
LRRGGRKWIGRGKYGIILMILLLYIIRMAEDPGTRMRIKRDV